MCGQIFNRSLPTYIINNSRMLLNLTKPLIVFDLETTGLDLVKDRIIQLSYIKVFPDGKEERENLFINPEKEIPQEVEELTGITNDDVAAAPTFKEKATELANKFTGCDFAGFNSNRFDIPLLAEEFLRAGVDFGFLEVPTYRCTEHLPQNGTPQPCRCLRILLWQKDGRRLHSPQSR